MGFSQWEKLFAQPIPPSRCQRRLCGSPSMAPYRKKQLEPRLRQLRPQTERKIVMSDKINEQAEKMRAIAQSTLDKAKDAVSNIWLNLKRCAKGPTLRASYSTAKDMNEKAV